MTDNTLHNTKHFTQNVNVLYKNMACLMKTIYHHISFPDINMCMEFLMVLCKIYYASLHTAQKHSFYNKKCFGNIISCLIHINLIQKCKLKPYKSLVHKGFSL